ncbi:hypothetical protein CLU79DRAFT_811656 [Phycomyces nitens]|nr:hypothetical protein CLU79DRAFT_811656 [Phycomyces nitens]
MSANKTLQSVQKTRPGVQTEAPPVASSDVGFFQDPPILTNQYEDDHVLKNILKRRIPLEIMNQIEPDLYRLGDRVVGDIALMGDSADDPNNHPRLRQYDAWNRRIDEITVSQGWKDLNSAAAEEGLVAIAYERKFKEYSRLYQFAKNYLFAPSSAVFLCPVSMTDGAARLIELLDDEGLKADFLPHLLSRDPKEFWTSGQWMTERPGGSDLANSETLAVLSDPENNIWDINGFKWFSSATTADMTMLLARTIDPQTGMVTKGTKGLSLYIAKMRTPEGNMNGVRVQRLKNKYGTKALPTAELELKGMKAQMIGEVGRGIPKISTILNITRLYACLGVVSALRRSLAIAKVFATKRQAFTKQLDRLPLHITTLATLEITVRASTQILFYTVELLGKTECLQDSPGHKQDLEMFRFLTPIAKGFVCKIGISACSEAMEAIGGQGYMEEIGIGRQMRDSQVNTIWEGTTNVMAMDVLRVLKETKGRVMGIFSSTMAAKVETAVSVNPEIFKSIGSIINDALENIQVFVKNTTDPLQLEASARQLMFSLGRVLAAILLLEQASWAVAHGVPGAQDDVTVVRRWCTTNDFGQPITVLDQDSLLEEARIVFGPQARL